MRLTCPSCGAQYDVPPGAIPPGGRDVQCSACSHTWFEPPAGSPPESEPWEQVPHVADGEEEAEDLAEAEAAPPPRSSVTPEVAEILRAEAAREAQARAQEPVQTAVPAAGRPLAAPPPEDPPAASPPEEPSAVLLPEGRAPDPVPEPLRSSSRLARPAEREMDLDRINASLRATNNRIAGRPPQVGNQESRRGGSFAGGFWGALLVLALFASLYLAAPALMDIWPALAVVLEPYTAAVDDLRLWLGRRVESLLGAGEGAALPG